MEENTDKAELLFDFTSIGIIDVTEAFKQGTLEYLRKFNLIKGVKITDEKTCDSEENPMLYNFSLKGCDLEGRIFPFDELVYENQEYDIIVCNSRYKRGRLQIDAQIFHELRKGEKLPIQVSRKKFGKDPSFKIFNRIGGFVKNSRNGLYEKISVGSRVLVEVYNVKSFNGRIIVFTRPLRFI